MTPTEIIRELFESLEEVEDINHQALLRHTLMTMMQKPELGLTAEEVNSFIRIFREMVVGDPSWRRFAGHILSGGEASPMFDPEDFDGLVG